MQARITSQITLLTYDDRVLPSFGVGGGGGGGGSHNTRMPHFGLVFLTD